MTELLGRDEIEQALEQLAAHLRRAGVVGHIYLVGGAAMALAYDADRITRDVDALIVDAHGHVTRAASAVARERGLPRSWLNEQATAYIPRAPDDEAPVVFDHPNLKVTAASPRFVAAMKVRAARPRDIDDLQRLADVLGLTGVDELLAVHDEVFPGDPLPERTATRLRTYWPS